MNKFFLHLFITVGILITILCAGAGCSDTSYSQDKAPVESASIQAKQVTDLNAFHRHGQTFLTWTGITPKLLSSTITNGITAVHQPDYLHVYNSIKSTSSQIRYHVYRSSTRVTAQNINEAVLISEVEPLSGYYPEYLGRYWKKKKFAEKVIPLLGVNPETPLKDQQELYVYTAKETGKYYYAVLAVTNGKENTVISAGNATQEPIPETPAEPEPVLQWTRKLSSKDKYLYQKGPAEVQYYMTWVDKPYSNIPRSFIWSVAIPGSYDDKIPHALQLSLHSWGTSQDKGTYWYKTSPPAIRIASVNWPVQDWWYGYKENYDDTFQLKKIFTDSEVINFTENRLLHFISWVRKRWNIDPTLVFVEGQSMGGAGAMHLGLKRGDFFCYVNSWVGISSWRYNDHFRNGEKEKWGMKEQLKNYNGIKFDDWMDLSWWLRNYPFQETPFISFANGKNDNGIGWEQAVRTVEALRESKRPFVFRWGMKGHRERSIFLFDPEIMALNKSIPAFNNCSLDNNIGSATKLSHPSKFTPLKGKMAEDWYDGDSEGQINAYLRWQDVHEEEKLYEITIYLDKEAPKDICTVDLTPRRLQKFSAKPGQKVIWQLFDNTKKIIISGEVKTDKWGLVTLMQLPVSKKSSRLSLRIEP